MQNSLIKRSPGEMTGSIINYTLLILGALLCLLPFVYVVSVSVTSEFALGKYGASLIPKEFTLSAYTFIFQNSYRVIHAFKSSIFMTGMGTFLGVLVTAGFAYPLSKKKLPFRTPIMMYVFFSMLFGGGLIPFFIVIQKMGLFNSYWAIILPVCYNTWNMILMRNFFSAIPDSIEESALIDGANEVLIFFKIILPLSKPIIATISLFLAVGFWNEWFMSLLFLREMEKWPIMLFLKEIIESQSAADQMQSLSQMTTASSEAVRMATVFIFTFPILLVYPFAQKHFVKGVMIGSIKG
jgi:putative aldouronate transport system permease protein